MINRRMMTAVLLATVSVGCQTLQDVESAYYQIPVGSRLVLHKEIPIPPEAARIKIQGGEVRHYGLVDEYEPFCELEVEEVRSVAQRVHPDEFVITKVDHRTYDVGLSRDRVASLGMRIGFGGDGPLQTFYATILQLRSEAQPNVLKLTCQNDQRAFPGILYARHLTVAEIREALGTLFSLQLLGENSSERPSAGR